MKQILFLIEKMATKKTAVLNKISEFYHLDDVVVGKLDEFVNTVIKFNQNYNLIGKSTIADIWNRHILDSAQLIKFIDNKSIKLGDFGSGAGFPALILSILGIKEIHLIEKSFRKCQFLSEVKNISDNKIIIHQKLASQVEAIQFDVVTSRALAPLDKLLKITQPFLGKNSKAIFPKGKNLLNELNLIKDKNNFDYKIYPSLTSDEGNILVINNFNS